LGGTKEGKGEVKGGDVEGDGWETNREQTGIHYESQLVVLRW